MELACYEYTVLARTKVTDVKSGQEYLMFVSKMNLKGLLVSSLPQIPLESPVRLNISMGVKQDSVELDGAIYKNISSPQGTQGTIIRFINVNKDIEGKLKKFISTYEKESQKLAEKSHRTSPLIEKTAMVQESSLSHLSLSSPDRESGSIAFTVDEESVHNQSRGLSGNTIIATVKNLPKVRDRKRLVRTLLIILLTFLSIGFWATRARWTRLIEDPSKKTAQTSASEEIEQSPVEEQPLPKASIESISVSDSPSSISVLIQGQGGFPTHFISKSLDPKRLVIDFPEIQAVRTDSVLGVSKSPLLRVRAVEQSKGVRIYFDLYPVEFPKYNIESQSGSFTIVFTK